MKFRKRPVMVEAVQFTGENQQDIYKFAGERVDCFKTGVHLLTLEGTMSASVGDWIIQGVKGEFYPCKPDIFAQTYERVSEGLGGDHDR